MSCFSLKSEVLIQVYQGCQIALSVVLNELIDVISLLFLGKLGQHMLSSWALAFVFSNIIGKSIIVAFGYAVKLHLNRARTAYDVQLANIILQRSVLILCCICIPLCIIWIFCEPILITMGQSPDIARDARLCLVYMTPSLFFVSCTTCIQKWLHSVNRPLIPIYACTAASFAHPIFCFLFIFKWDLQLVGAGLGYATTRLLELILLIVYLLKSGVLIQKQFRLSSKAFDGWGLLCWDGLGQCVSVTDWWASEAVIFIAGMFSYPEVELSAMVIYRALLSIFSSFPQGIGEVCFLRISSALARCDTNDARKAVIVGPLLAGAVASTLAGILLSFSPHIAQLFISSDDSADISHLLQILMLPLCVYAVTDAVQCVLTNGVLRATHTLRQATPFITLCYYLVGVPVAVYLSVPGVPVRGQDWGVVGLGWGMACAVIAHVIVCTVFASRLSWKEINETWSSCEGEEDELEANELVESSDAIARGREGGRTGQGLINFIGETDSSSSSSSSFLHLSAGPSVPGDMAIADILMSSSATDNPSLQLRLQRFLSYLPQIRVASSARYDLVQSYTAALEDVSSHDTGLDDAFSIEL